MRALWVEDQYQDNKEYLGIMEKHGTEVFPARTVSEALRRVKEESFDMIVLDMRIPLGEGPMVDNLADLDYNGAHIVDYLEKKQLLGSLRVFCLTNFVSVARRLLEGKGVHIIRKAGFLREFEEAVYGGD